MMRMNLLCVVIVNLNSNMVRLGIIGLSGMKESGSVISVVVI